MAEALRQQYVDMNAPLLAPENLLPDAYASTSKGGKKVQRVPWGCFHDPGVD